MPALKISRLGDVQRSAIEIYVLDPIHAESAEQDGLEPFPGSMDGSTLMITLDCVDLASSTLQTPQIAPTMTGIRNCERLS